MQTDSLHAIPSRSGTLTAWLDIFLFDAEVVQRSLGTISFYREKLTPFVAFLTDVGVTHPAQLDANHLRAFLSQIGRGRTVGGIHAYWRALRAYLRYLVRQGALDRNPLDLLRAPRLEQPLLEPVAPDVIAALLAACEGTPTGVRDRAMLLVLCDTGLRAGELLALDVGDLDLAEGLVQVRTSKNRQGRFVFFGKTTREALTVWLQLRKSLGAGTALWVAQHTSGVHTRLTYDGLRARLERCAARANVPPPSPHAFRRTFALTMLRNGADVFSLSRLMGHGTLPVLLRYLDQLPEDLRSVHRRYSPVEHFSENRV